MGFLNIFRTKNFDSRCRRASYAGGRVSLLFSLFLAALLCATAYVERAWADVPVIVAVPDVDSSGSPELSALTRDAASAKNYAYVIDASDGAQVTGLEFDSSLDTLFQAVVPDVNGNGTPEIAVLGVTYASSVVDTVRVIIKDSVSGAWVKEIAFDGNFPPIAMAVVEYPSGYTSSNVGIAVLGRKVSTGPNTATVKVSIRDAVSGALITNAYFTKEFQPVAMAVVPDFAGTSAPEIAVLAEGDSDAGSAGKIAAIVADAGNGSRITKIGFDPLSLPVDMKVVQMGGDIGIAVLGVRVSDDSVKVVIRNVATSAVIGAAVFFPTEYPPVAMAVVPDFAGTSAPEIAVLGVGNSALGGVQGKVRITVKDASSGARVGDLLYFSKEYAPVGMAVADDFADTVASEIAVFGVNSDGEKNITIRDASSATFIGGFLLPPYVSGVSGDIVRLSTASDGTQGDSNSYSPSTSAGGRYVAFGSEAATLVLGDTNGARDIFVHDASGGTTTRVSVDSYGAQSNGASSYPSTSSDGRYVVFSSVASNLVSGDTNGSSDVFVRDTVANTTKRVSVAYNGAQSNGNSGGENRGVAISDDGRYVVFLSYASNLVSGDTNGISDIFVRDTVGNTTTLVSVGVGRMGRAEAGNGSSEAGVSITADGRYVAFRSAASNLVAYDTNGAYDIFVRDTVESTTTRVSVKTDGMGGTESNGNSGGAFISSGGRYVSFKSVASNLVAGDTNGSSDIFVRDMMANSTVRVSVASGGAQSDGGVGASSISSDGRYVTFKSSSANLVSGDTNGVTDIFVHDMQTGVVTRVDVAADGTQGNGKSYGASISGDGRYVTFTSYSSNLVAGDSNGAWDIFRTTNPL